MVGSLQPWRRSMTLTSPISSRSESGVKSVLRSDGESPGAPSASVQSRGNSIAVPSFSRMDTWVPASLLTSNF